ncbi:hypothetical protein CEXT_435331 [Caerostris extrusa]|uniref:Uncharacterized protein n=1 Tax=Caerostris extrusa TaxID=172846 RepID=A0AAV4SNP9_CAEEX|nr:hypothetical protein CEXT_435331 [Caerostris extrusa]
MDLSPSGDEAKRLSETTPPNAQSANDPPPVITDQFLYDNVDEQLKIIELKSKLTAGWFRPAVCINNPELAKKYDLIYENNMKEMNARCANLRISHMMCQ